MHFFFVIGAVAGWFVVSLVYGRPMPALSLPTIIGVVVGGVIAQVAGFAIATANQHDPQNKGDAGVPKNRGGSVP